jgi:hypothetical protein
MECICLLFLYIVNKQQWRHFGKGTQCGTMGNVDRITFQILNHGYDRFE